MQVNHTIREITDKNADSKLPFYQVLNSISNSECKRFLSDFMALKGGIAVSSPKAQAVVENGGVSFRDVYNNFRERGAVGIHDLPEIISGVLIKVKSSNVDLTHRKLSRFVKAKNFLDHQIMLSINGLEAREVKENSEIPMTAPNGEFCLIAVKTHRARVPIGRDAVFNDQIDFAELPILLNKSAYRKEIEKTFNAIESNPNLSDGSPLFNASNSLEAPADITFAAGLELFRKQKSANGSYEFLNPKFLIVPPSEELAARKELRDVSLESSIEVIVNPLVTCTYLLADPELHPVIIRLGLNDMPIVGSIKPDFKSDAALVLDLTHDFDIAPITRVGIVRMKP